MPKHAANMLKVHAKGLLKTKNNSRFQGKENEGTLKETKFPHKASGRLGKALFGLITCKAFGRPGLWLGSSSFRSGLPYLPYLGTLSYHLAAGSTLALRIP